MEVIISIATTINYRVNKFEKKYIVNLNVLTKSTEEKKGNANAPNNILFVEYMAHTVASYAWKVF